jgi:hypothetical protein
MSPSRRTTVRWAPSWRPGRISRPFLRLHGLAASTRAILVAVTAALGS